MKTLRIKNGIAYWSAVSGLTRKITTARDERLKMKASAMRDNVITTDALAY